jgi:hypothetical protein
MPNPSPTHQVAADRAMRYLYHHKNLALEFGSTDEGYLFQLFGGPIDWKSTRQRTVTTSSTEAELLAISHAARDLYWWRRLFQNLTLSFEHDFTIQCDNQQTINLMETGAQKLVTKLKHVDIHQHWLHQEVQEERLHL